MPIQFLNPTALPLDVSRTEREYIEQLTKDNDDPSKQHHVIVRCWNDASGRYEPARFYEPTDQQLTLCLSELAPILARTQVEPACACTERYTALRQALDAVLTATTGYQLTQASFDALKAALSKDVVKRLKEFSGQVFYSLPDFSRAIIPILQHFFKDDASLKQAGMHILEACQAVGILEDARRQRVAELSVALDEWHGVVPQKPIPPTSQPCPFCRLPYRYGLMDVLPHEQDAISRLTQSIVGAPVMLQDIPVVFAALEMWLFADDDHYYAKKNPILGQTAAFRLLTGLKDKINTVRLAWLRSTDSVESPAPISPVSASTSSDVPPPPPPPATPAAS